MTEWRIRLKRILFMYERLRELEVEIVWGDPAVALAAGADTHHCQRIVTVTRVSLHLFKIFQRLDAAS
ncbi:MAG: hypothetical protein KDE51_18400 [Anaerolineales bacterium]|nr:hypothetical protein [Anaerolineales bacterium]